MTEVTVESAICSRPLGTAPISRCRLGKMGLVLPTPQDWHFHLFSSTAFAALRASSSLSQLPFAHTLTPLRNTKTSLPTQIQLVSILLLICIMQSRSKMLIPWLSILECKKNADSSRSFMSWVCFSAPPPPHSSSPESLCAAPHLSSPGSAVQIFKGNLF